MPVFRVETTVTTIVTKYVKAPTKKAVTLWAEEQEWDAADGEQVDDVETTIERDDSEDYEVRIDRDGEELD